MGDWIERKDRRRLPLTQQQAHSPTRANLCPTSDPEPRVVVVVTMSGLAERKEAVAFLDQIARQEANPWRRAPIASAWRRLRAPRGWFYLPVGVYRTPPVRGKGRAHLSPSSCGSHIDLSFSP